MLEVVKRRRNGIIRCGPWRLRLLIECLCSAQTHLSLVATSYAQQRCSLAALQPRQKVGHWLRPSDIAAASQHPFGSGVFLDPLLKGGTPLDASLEGSLGDSGGSGLADLEKQIRRLAEQGLTQGASKTAALEVVVAVAIAGVRAARRSLAKEGHGGADLCAGLDEGEGGPFFLPPFLGSSRRRRRVGGPKKSSS